jgi:hypothetical protein
MRAVMPSAGKSARAAGGALLTLAHKFRTVVSGISIMAPPRGTPKPPGSGRKKGTPNRVKTPSVRAKIAEIQAEALERVENTLGKQTPLEFALACMHDDSYPPAFRLEACKIAMPYIHAKKAEEPNQDKPVITEIRQIIVHPRDYTDEDRELISKGFSPAPYEVHPRRSLDDLAQPDEASSTVVEHGIVRAEMAPERAPDPLTIARSRIDTDAWNPLMTDWTPPDKYEGKLVLPGNAVRSPAPDGRVAPPAPDEPSAFDRIAAAIEAAAPKPTDPHAYWLWDETGRRISPKLPSAFEPIARHAERPPSRATHWSD